MLAKDTIVFANVDDRCNRCLAKGDQSVAMLTKLIFYILYSHQKFTKDGLYHEYVVR